jgi:cytochrome c oxidase subunit 1
MSTATHAHDTHGHDHGHGEAHDHHGPPAGFTRWMYTTNHKDIGTMYLWFACFMFFLGGTMAMVIRLELFQPGLQFVDPEFFNSLTTIHGLVMVFGAIMPAFVGFANWLVPMQIGAADMAFPRMNNWSFWLLIPAALLLMGSFLAPGGAADMAFPRMNNWSFWLLIPAALLLIGSFFVPGGAAGSGWTLYPPLIIQQGMAIDMTILAIHLLGASSIMGSINIITTILNMRAPGMTLMRMPLFVWTWLITAYLLIAVMPVLAGAVTMLLTDRHFGTSFFNAAGGGDPTMFLHIFWFFGHPEVYIMIFPAFGIVSTIIPAFSRKPLFGYASMVYATSSIAILSFLVWAHHMFTVGMPAAGQLFFMYMTMLIAVPTGVKVFNWVATMWRGSMTFETPMLFAIGFVFLFTMGGFTGLVLAITPVDIALQDTYYVVAHFHYVLVAGSLFAFFGGIYYWLPKWCGRMYNETMGKWHFWLSMIFFNVTFFPMHFLGLAGMPRRVPDYATQFADWNVVASIGAFGFGLSQLLLLYNVVTCIRSGPPAPAKPWEGADTLEWTLPSPAPYHTFETPPVVE